MKLLLIGLCFLPNTILAQENHREATPEEKQFILPNDEEKRMKELGVEASKDAERNIMNKVLLRQALVKGKLNDDQIKSYIQKLTDQGLSKKQIRDEIENLSNNYFAELQLKDLEKVLSPEKQKIYETKFAQLQKRYEEENLTHEELDREISSLDAEISQSSATKENEVKLAEFKQSLLTMDQDNTFVKKPYVFDPKHFGPIKVMVPKNFNLNPLCLDQAGASHSAQLDLLNEQMKSITTSGEVKNKPFIHEIYFAWGYNRNYHSNTDVKFTTADGTFTVHDTVGKDRPSPFSPEVYFNPTKMSIPQYNMEIGVMFNEKWGIEAKQDHMKLVFDNSRPYEMTGEYNRQVVVTNEHPTSEWDQQIPVDFSVAKANKDATWLNFEHSDGYNYVSLGAVYNQRLYQTKKEKFKIDSRFGAGAGLMIPKTKVMMHQDRQWNWEGLDNKFHVAGGGVHAEAKLRFTFWNSVFLQAATRGTYIKVKDALVDGSDSRMEHIQPIASVQFMGQIGYVHTFKPKKKKIPKE